MKCSSKYDFEFICHMASHAVNRPVILIYINLIRNSQGVQNLFLSLLRSQRTWAFGAPH